jgi:hypothetical protein
MYTVLFDANVLYPAPMRDLLMQLALSDLFRAHWTEQINDEWIEALLKKEPHRDRQKLERTRALMNKAVRGCLIENYKGLIPSLIGLPDENDRHVLAAAIAGRCDCIVTQNLKDFPDAAMAAYGIEIQHPDEFLSNLINLSPGRFCASVQKVRARLKNPPYSAAEYLDVMRNVGLIATASELAEFDQLI